MATQFSSGSRFFTLSKCGKLGLLLIIEKFLEFLVILKMYIKFLTKGNFISENQIYYKQLQKTKKVFFKHYPHIFFLLFFV